MPLYESAEMYLETIYRLSKERSNVRSIDVAEEMGYSKPSVSRAVGLLKNGGYLTVDTNGSLSLSEEGRAVAEKIFERHTVLVSLLTALGVSEATATEDACKIEHVISDETFRILKEHQAQYGKLK
ncbi:MAG: metal-dependent transcriptional regulator [Oscillospiraceae bacterium]|nr:metal-dependent transcriptional regulator [Oscillospiraceae bacterium]